MTGILLTRGAIAAGVDTLRRQVAEADDTLGSCIALAGLDMLHAILCCAEDLADEAADVAWAEPEPEEEPPAAPEEADPPPADPAEGTAGTPDPRSAADAPEANTLPIWTEPRLAILRRDYLTAPSLVALHSALNALPGPPIASWNSMAKKASTLGLAKRAPLGRHHAEAPAPDTRTEEEREAEALVRADPTTWHGRAIAEEYGWPIPQAAAFVQRIRAAMAAEAEVAALRRALGLHASATATSARSMT